MMLESIVTLIRETQPRWRQLLLGLPEEPGVGAGGQGGPGVERSTSGGTIGTVGTSVGLGGGPAGPGGPPQLSTAVSTPSASDYLMAAAGTSGVLGAAMIGNNPSSSIQALNQDGSTATVGLVEQLLKFTLGSHAS